MITDGLKTKDEVAVCELVIGVVMLRPRYMAAHRKRAYLGKENPFGKDKDVADNSIQTGALAPGEYILRNALNSNDHRPYLVDGIPVGAVLTFQVPD